MSAMSRLSLIAGITGVGASFAALAAVPSIRAHVLRMLGLQAPGGVWRVLFIALAVLNLKNLPFVWHFRLFRALIYQLRLQPTPLPPASLFEPIITSSYAPLCETDYNIHKSNSTYFSDLDISRTHLIGALFRNGILEADRRKRNGEHGRHAMAFGGVTCHFKREVLPYRRYEIWTRLLSWDRKWIYLVSHIVEAGAFKPKKYTLQPWKKGGSRPADRNEAEYRERLKKCVYASSISKYVVKHGRMTVPTDIVMEKAGLVPPKPATHSNTSASSELTAAGSFEDSILPVNGSKWTWEEIEAERLRGLEFAEKFAALDGLHELFDAGERGALGEFPDLLW